MKRFREHWCSVAKCHTFRCVADMCSVLRDSGGTTPGPPSGGPPGRVAGADRRDSRALLPASDRLSGGEGPAFPPAVVILSPSTDPSGDGKDLLSRVVPEHPHTLRPSADGARAASIGKMKKQGRAVRRLSGRSEGLAPGLSNSGHIFTSRSPKAGCAG